jgi:hypothetical protein
VRGLSSRRMPACDLDALACVLARLFLIFY